MSNSETGGPAFPVPTENKKGMTLRDYFAGQALEGSLASPALLEVVTTGSILDGSMFTRLAANVYEIADAMIEQKRLREARP